jgi:outer membrane lipoprotein SlyB
MIGNRERVSAKRWVARLWRYRLETCATGGWIGFGMLGGVLGGPIGALIGGVLGWIIGASIDAQLDEREQRRHAA